MKTIKTLYPNGKIKAVSFSYDDGVCFDKQLISILDKNGLKGTFNINSGCLNSEIGWQTTDGKDRISLIDEAEAAEVYKNHEVAIHGLTHPFWSNMPKEQALYQMQQDKINLERIVGYPVRGLAYPFYSYDENIHKIAEILGIRYARTAIKGQFFQLPQDPLHFNATCHHNDPEMMTMAAKFIKETFNTLAIFCVYGHTFEFANDHNWNVIEEFCEFIAHRDEIWYATCIQIFDYLNASKQLIFTSDCSIVHNPTATDITLMVDNEVIIVHCGETLSL